MRSVMMLGFSELTLTQKLALSNENVIARVQSGEWTVNQFAEWIDERLNYAFGDGYEEGYSSAEEQQKYKAQMSMN